MLMFLEPDIFVVLVCTVVSILLYFILHPFSSRDQYDNQVSRDQYETPVSRDIGNGVRISSICPGDDVVDKPYKGIETIYDAFQRGLGISATGPCMGERSGDRYIWTTYSQLETRVKEFGSGLIAEGIRAGGDDFIGIIGVNCLDWVVAELGAMFYSVVFVPMYDTLGDEAMSHILQQTGCQVVVAHPDKLVKMLNFLQSGPHKVRVVVKRKSDPTPEEQEQFMELGVTLKSMQDMEKIGRSAPKDPVPPAPQDVFTICYTSGTTGIPKGALISHQNMTTFMAGVMLTNQHFILAPNDVHFSYLPLCHLFEMNVHMIVYTAGACVGFYSGSSLTIAEDIKILRPSFFPAVPRVLNKFMDKIQKAVAEKGVVAKWLFEKALSSKFADLKKGVVSRNMWDRILFKKIRDSFGGRISLIITGAAPILPDTLNFFRAVFAANVYEGYGQTESVGCTLTQPLDFTGGHVGPPLPSNLIKLVDSSETGHFVSDGKGEICVKGKNVFRGYYKDEVNTRVALDGDGWLHTGDIGEWTLMGYLRIIDRKKNIFKTSLGEYIAPEKIENVYELHEMIQQMFIDGDSKKSKIAGIIVPEKDNFTKWTSSIIGKDGMSYDDLLEDATVKNKFLSLVNSFAKARLQPFELVAKIKLVDITLTVENDLLTPTFKKKRQHLRRYFSQTFDDMNSELL